MERKRRGDVALDRALRAALRRGGELVHLGRQHEHRPAARQVAGEQRAVEVGEPVPRIDDQHEPDQRLPRREIAGEELLPVTLQRLRHRRVAVARQVGEQRAAAQAKEVDLLRAARRLAGEREPRPVGERVDRARLAGIGAAGKRDFRRPRRRQLRVVGDGETNSACWSGCFTARRAPRGRPRAAPALAGPGDSVTMRCFCTIGSAPRGRIEPDSRPGCPPAPSRSHPMKRMLLLAARRRRAVRGRRTGADPAGKARSRQGADDRQGGLLRLPRRPTATARAP